MSKLIAHLAIFITISTVGLSGCSKSESRIYTCLNSASGTCSETYNDTQENAELICRGELRQGSSCPEKGLIGHCQKRKHGEDFREIYEVKSYYRPISEGWSQDKLRERCSGTWLQPGQQASIPEEYLPGS